MRTSVGNGTIGEMVEAGLGNRLSMSSAKAVGARSWSEYTHAYCWAGVAGYGWINSAALPAIVISLNGAAVMSGTWISTRY